LSSNSNIFYFFFFFFFLRVDLLRCSLNAAHSVFLRRDHAKTDKIIKNSP